MPKRHVFEKHKASCERVTDSWNEVRVPRKQDKHKLNESNGSSEGEGSWKSLHLCQFNRAEKNSEELNWGETSQIELRRVEKKWTEMRVVEKSWQEVRSPQKSWEEVARSENRRKARIVENKKTNSENRVEKMWGLAASPIGKPCLWILWCNSPSFWKLPPPASRGFYL